MRRREKTKSRSPAPTAAGAAPAPPSWPLVEFACPRSPCTCLPRRGSIAEYRAISPLKWRALVGEGGVDQDVVVDIDLPVEIEIPVDPAGESTGKAGVDSHVIVDVDLAVEIRIALVGVFDADLIRPQFADAERRLRVG